MRNLAAMFVLLTSFQVMAENQVKLFVNLSPAGSFEAVSNKPRGNLIKSGNTFSSDKITVSIESFKTGISLRDEHFWKHLHSADHGRAVLSQLKAQNGKGSGMLEINGVKKPITITYVEKASDVVARFRVKASDFKLSKAQYMGVGVNDDVDVEAVLAYKSK